MDTGFGSLLFKRESQLRGSKKATSGLSLRAFVIFFFFTFYKTIVSPFLHTLGISGSGCRFHPTCSQYSLNAFQNEKFFKALYLSLVRLSKCHPWGVG